MLIYDCEIVKGILKRGEWEIPGIDYVTERGPGAWRAFDEMGISVICAYDYREERTRIFCRDNMAEFQNLIHARDVVVGFNNQSFDDPLCAAHGVAVPEEKSYDILVEVWAGAGLGRKFQSPSHIGFSLGAICEENFGIAKSGNGAWAPVDWQQGRVGTVIDYCAHDVYMTKLLLDRIIARRIILDPRTKKRLNVKPPSLVSG